MAGALQPRAEVAAQQGQRQHRFDQAAQVGRAVGGVVVQPPGLGRGGRMGQHRAVGRLALLQGIARKAIAVGAGQHLDGTGGDVDLRQRGHAGGGALMQMRPALGRQAGAGTGIGMAGHAAQQQLGLGLGRGHHGQGEGGTLQHRLAAQHGGARPGLEGAGRWRCRNARPGLRRRGQPGLQGQQQALGIRRHGRQGRYSDQRRAGVGAGAYGSGRHKAGG